MSSNRLDLIHRGADISFHHKAWNGQKLNTNWSSLGGNFVFEPVTLLWGPDLVYTFGVDFNSVIQYKALQKLTGKWSEKWIELKAFHASTGEEGARPASEEVKWAARPSVISLYPKSMEIVGLGSDNMLYHGSWKPGSGWSTFTALPDKHFREPPSLTSWGSGRFDVFALGLDGNIYHRWWVKKKGWLPVVSKGITRPSSLATSSVDGEWEDAIQGRGRARESEDSKAQKVIEVPAWENLQGPFTYTPSAIAWAKERIDLVGITGGGKVYHRFWDEDAVAWSPKWDEVQMTSGPVGKPEVVSWGPNRLDIFVIGSDRAIHHKWLNTSGSNKWEPPKEDESLEGKALGDQVTAASMGPENLVVFHTGDKFGLFVKSWTVADGWSTLKDTVSNHNALGGTVTARIAACAAQDAMFNP